METQGKSPKKPRGQKEIKWRVHYAIVKKASNRNLRLEDDDEREKIEA